MTTKNNSLKFSVRFSVRDGDDGDIWWWNFNDDEREMLFGPLEKHFGVRFKEHEKRRYVESIEELVNKRERDADPFIDDPRLEVSAGNPDTPSFHVSLVCREYISIDKPHLESCTCDGCAVAKTALEAVY